MAKPLVDIRCASLEDIPQLHKALLALSKDLGDTHRASPEDLAAACMGPIPCAYGFLATSHHTLQCAALASPLFSTTQGGAGVYISDLWVSSACRGQGVGRLLLAFVAHFAQHHWQAGFLKLAVYTHNTQALAFYQQLGFIPMQDDHTYLLQPDSLQQFLSDQPWRA